jgi:restriction system protein
MHYTASMAIPDFQTLMLPLLRFLGDHKERSIGETVEALSSEYGLTQPEREQMLSSGQQSTIRNRIGWSKTYMSKAGLIENVRRGYFRITERGTGALAEKPDRIDMRFLERYPEFLEFRKLRHEPDAVPAEPSPPQTAETPEEAIESAHRRLRLDLEAEVLQHVKSASPAFFERLVVELLVRMGYGGNRRDAGEAVGRSGDGGVDGIIKEDRLGLDVVYVQAKRWEATVGRPEIQKFAGVLQGHRARKGVFITTSSYSTEAKEFAERIDSRIVLVDGEMLAGLMVDHDVGVSKLQAYEVKKVDSDFFMEE